MEKEISCNVSIITEKMQDKEVYLARCEELGISDFGDTPEEAIEHLKTAIKLFFDPIEKSTGKVYDEPCHRIMKKNCELANTDWISKNHWCVPIYYKGNERSL